MTNTRAAALLFLFLAMLELGTTNHTTAIALSGAAVILSLIFFTLDAKRRR